MIKTKLQISALSEEETTPYDLLKLADPSTSHIEAYLKTGTCFIAKHSSESVGVVVLNEVDPTTIEIKNIAILPSQQNKGFGKQLLAFSEDTCRQNGYHTLMIGTGNSSIAQLAMYQRFGFEISEIKYNFFIDNYAQPIVENGIRCKHMIILKKSLTDSTL